jgi:hypothetical protein
MNESLTTVKALLSEGHGDRHIAGALGVTRHEARNLMRQVEREQAGGVMEVPVALCRPSPTARQVQDIRVESLVVSIQQIGLRQPINVRPVGDGYEIRGGGHRHAAFVKLGRITIPAFVRDDDDLRAELAEIDENLVRSELSPAARAQAIGRRKTIYEQLYPETVAGVAGGKARQGSASDNLSFAESTATDIGKTRRTIERDAHRYEALGDATLAKVTGTSLDTGEQLDALAKLAEPERERIIERAAAGEEVSAKPEEPAAPNLPSNSRVVAPTRVEPDDSRDYAPTPPWATRALIKVVLPELGVDLRHKVLGEPACGEGHIAEVLREVSGYVFASDLFEYGYSDQPTLDYLTATPEANGTSDWTITNPPFNKAEEFALKAFDMSNEGVALFVRLQWLEGVGRFERLFDATPPALIAIFAERVPLHMGRWEPDGDTMTAYCWIIWKKNGISPFKTKTRAFWIPPGQRNALSMSDDVERFTAHPVTKKDHVIAPVPAEPVREPAPIPHSGLPQTDIKEIDLDKDMPDFLRRKAEPAEEVK